MRVRLARAATWATAVAVIAAGCSGGDPSGDDPSDADPEGAEEPGDSGGTISDDVVLSGALLRFDACDDLLSYVTENAMDLVGPYGLGGRWGYAGFGDEAVEEEMAADGDMAVTDDAGGADALAAPRAATPQEGVDYSGTNVQETGVDEPDTLKTDGEHLYLVRDRWLDIVDVTGAEPELVSSTDLGGWGSTMLRAGDRLLVMGQSEGEPLPLGGDMALPASGTLLSLYDVSDAAAPELVSTLQLDGNVVSSRLVDGVARVVLRAEPVGLPFVTPEGSGLRAERDATEQNREIIAESSVDNWVPYYVHRTPGGSESEGSLLPCDRVHHPDEFAGLGTTSVLSLDLAEDLSPQGSTGVLAGSGTVYSSAERLYVATNAWVRRDELTEADIRELDESYSTDLHAFDITDPESADYVGSGNVRGHVLNQFSMSEHEGILRVATTEGSPWSAAQTSESFVTTFAEEDGALTRIGQAGGLGKGERIYAVRFTGDVGYVVTFRETDPLYTLDLSDPADPQVLGELKILGYSSYLHPIGNGMVLGIGQDADEQGRTRGMQLSLFDVSDLNNPERIHQVTLEDASSNAEYDHHAFLHWPATGLTVVPFQAWSVDEVERTEKLTSGALAYRLGLGTGFEEVGDGRVTHQPEALPDDVLDELTGDEPELRYELAWQAQIERSVVIGDTLYTISRLGIKGSDAETLADESWLTLPEQR